MNTKNKILLTLIVFCLPFQTFAQKPNYTGTWVLNLKKSKLESRPEGLTSSVFIIKQEGDKFKLTRTHIFGEKKKIVSFEMIADGNIRRIKFIYKGKLEWKEKNLQVTLWRNNRFNIVNYKFGNNKNELIADEKSSGNQKNHHNIWVFERDIL